MKSSIKDSNQRSLPLVLTVLAVATVCLAIAALCIGSYSIPVRDTLNILVSTVTGVVGDWAQMAETVVLQVRVPRVLAAILVGAALAVAGTSYQGIFRTGGNRASAHAKNNIVCLFPFPVNNGILSAKE